MAEHGADSYVEPAVQAAVHDEQTRLVVVEHGVVSYVEPATQVEQAEQVWAELRALEYVVASQATQVADEPVPDTFLPEVVQPQETTPFERLQVKPVTAMHVDAPAREDEPSGQVVHVVAPAAE